MEMGIHIFSSNHFTRESHPAALVVETSPLLVPLEDAVVVGSDLVVETSPLLVPLEDAVVVGSDLVIETSPLLVPLEDDVVVGSDLVVETLPPCFLCTTTEGADSATEIPVPFVHAEGAFIF